VSADDARGIEWYSGARSTLLGSLLDLARACIQPQWWRRVDVTDRAGRTQSVHPDQIRLRKDVMTGIPAWAPPAAADASTTFINTHQRPYYTTIFRAFTPLTAFVINSLIVSFAVSSGATAGDRGGVRLTAWRRQRAAPARG